MAGLGLLDMGGVDPSQDSGLLGKILPAEASPLGSLLMPGQLNALRHQALINFGANILSQQAPHPQGTGPSFLSSIGDAVKGMNWPGTLSEAGAQGMNLEQLMYKLQMMQKMREIGAANPIDPHAPIEAQIGAVKNRIGQMGAIDPAEAAHFNPTLAALIRQQHYQNPATTQGKDQLAQMGGYATIFRPGKGYWNPNPNGSETGPDGQKGDWSFSLPRTLSEDAKAQALATRQLALARMQQTQSIHEQNLGKALAGQFDTRNTDLYKSMQSYTLVKNGLAQARAGNQAAFESVLAQYVQNLDPKAQLRSQLLQKLENVAPSIGGRAAILSGKWLGGRLPPKVLDDMERVVDQTHGSIKALYNQRYKEFVRKNPNAEPYVSTPEGQFDLPENEKPSLDDLSEEEDQE